LRSTGELRVDPHLRRATEVSRDGKDFVRRFAALDFVLGESAGRADTVSGRHDKVRLAQHVVEDLPAR
jgi:hypothetical protein